VFYSLDSEGNEQVSCGGTEILASDPQGDGFQSCAASSFIEGFECEAGLSGKMKDAPHSIWVSDSEGIGGWLEVTFKDKYMI